MVSLHAPQPIVKLTEPEEVSLTSLDTWHTLSSGHLLDSLNVCRVVDAHIGQLSLFEIRLHPDFALNQIDHLRSGSDQLAGQGVALPPGRRR